MAHGTVKYFNDQKGYGFITPDGQESSEVYVHFSAIESGGFRTLHEGERVDSSWSAVPEATKRPTS